jgi:nucleoside-diphosphate-sugar epimerase
MIQVLVLGGNGFIGKHLVNYFKNNPGIQVTLASRSVDTINGENIFLDRDILQKTVFKFFDVIIDLSCYSFKHLINVISCLKFNKYIFLSSMAVTRIFTLSKNNNETSIRNTFIYAKEKALCEEYIVDNIPNYTIIRPDYVMGDGDPLDRFIHKEGKYFWKKDNTPVTSYTTIESLLNIINTSIRENTGKIILCTR